MYILQKHENSHFAHILASVSFAQFSFIRMGRHAVVFLSTFSQSTRKSIFARFFLMYYVCLHFIRAVMRLLFLSSQTLRQRYGDFEAPFFSAESHCDLFFYKYTQKWRSRDMWCFRSIFIIHIGIKLKHVTLLVRFINIVSEMRLVLLWDLLNKLEHFFKYLLETNFLGFRGAKVNLKCANSLF